MSRTGFSVEGFDEVDSRLEALGSVMTNRDRVMPVILDALDPVVERAQQIVAVSSGRLRNSIGASETADGAGNDDLAGYVGPSSDVFYAEDVEFGRPASISQSGREWDAVEAKPFMRPAWDGEAPTVIDRLSAGLRKAVKQTAED